MKLKYVKDAIIDGIGMLAIIGTTMVVGFTMFIFIFIPVIVWLGGLV